MCTVRVIAKQRGITQDNNDINILHGNILEGSLIVGVDSRELRSVKKQIYLHQSRFYNQADGILDNFCEL